MTIAYWCVLVMIIFPYIFVFLAKGGPKFDNNDPRGYLATLTGWRKRANYIQLNSFETTPVFGLAIIIAELTHATQTYVDGLAIAFVITRILYALCYLTEKSTLRTLCWMAGFVCIIALFCVPREISINHFL